MGMPFAKIQALGAEFLGCLFQFGLNKNDVAIKIDGGFCGLWPRTRCSENDGGWAS
jgi:hypothetical protein